MVLVIVDTLRADHLGCYGTTPCMATIFTGLLSPAHRPLFNPAAVMMENIFLEALQNPGYIQEVCNGSFYRLP